MLSDAAEKKLQEIEKFCCEIYQKYRSELKSNRNNIQDADGTPKYHKSFGFLLNSHNPPSSAAELEEHAKKYLDPAKSWQGKLWKMLVDFAELLGTFPFVGVGVGFSCWTPLHTDSHNVGSSHQLTAGPYWEQLNAWEINAAGIF